MIKHHLVVCVHKKKADKTKGDLVVEDVVFIIIQQPKVNEDDALMVELLKEQVEVKVPLSSQPHL